EENIESRPLWKPMHLQPIFADAPYYGGKVSETLFDNGLCLPSGSNMTDEERERIAKVILKFQW
ncbi:DegT/DnrJ/EryC1/StrS family aminotransferase, partial [Capnocytophaga canis]